MKHDVDSPQHNKPPFADCVASFKKSLKALKALPVQQQPPETSHSAVQATPEDSGIEPERLATHEELLILQRAGETLARIRAAVDKDAIDPDLLPQIERLARQKKEELGNAWIHTRAVGHLPKTSMSEEARKLVTDLNKWSSYMVETIYIDGKGKKGSMRVSAELFGQAVGAIRERGGNDTDIALLQGHFIHVCRDIGYTADSAHHVR